jgi:GNAT superfamily N-acetyltransferase
VTALDLPRPADALRISDDPAALDRDLVHRFLSTQAYWSRNIPRETMDRAIDNSLCFGGYLGTRQVAFARVVTDGATFANLVDVFVLPEHRGKGYAQALVAAIVAHPRLQGLRRFRLDTADAHGLYARFGFRAPTKPENVMERWFPRIYDGDDTPG